MDVYMYRPIDLDGPTLRLLRLHRGDSQDEIRCDLFDAWLEGGIPYDALSYTWGSTDRAAMIKVDGWKMHITSNLYVALQHLRLKSQDRILWIDAICIDQNNKLERGHQVQHMSSIYKMAEQVVIWLGEGTKESDLVMDAMKRLQQNNTQVEGDWRRSAQLWMYPWPATRPTLEVLHIHQKELREGMELILKRPWFRRIWILQEIANARVATIHCGDKSCSARIFAQVPSLIELQPNPHCQAVLDIMPGLSRKESWWGQKRNLYTLLLKFRESNATDERDIIYALLGISSDACKSDILIPDYTKSVEEVIRDTTRFLVSYTKQDASLFSYLNWSLPAFLRNLDSLSTEVLRGAVERWQESTAKLLTTTSIGDSAIKSGRTPLQIVWDNNDAIVQLLVEHGAGLESKDIKGQTPLSWAAMNGHKDIVQLLLDQGADLESKDNKGQTPLSWAAINGHTDIVRLLLERGARFELDDAELESKDNKSRTPLYLAAGNGNEAVMRLFLERGAEFDSKDPYGRTLLSLAAGKGHKAIVWLLLERGAEFESADIDGRTPLIWAAVNGHEAVVRLLLERGAEFELVDIDGRTPLIWAAVNRHEAVVRLLLEQGVELESKDSHGRTSLVWAAILGDEVVVRLLLEQGAEFNSKDFQGRTSLSWASQSWWCEGIVQLLLNRGAECDSKDTLGRTALSWASENGCEGTVQLLLNRGAEFESADIDGKTPLSRATEKGHGGIRKLLLERREKIGVDRPPNI